jgi:ribonuclease J
MQIRIIKGTKQIGGCITEISTAKTKIIIDYGNDLDDGKEPLEVEGLTFGNSQYDGVFITHSHGDHIGLINKINEDIPVFVEEKSLEIHNITCDFCNKDRVNRKINTFKFPKNKNSKIIFDNNDIKVTAYLGEHSSYNSCMFLIESEGKKILHTGDYRAHGRKYARFINSLNKIGKLDLLITEGTALTRPASKYMTEEGLEKEAVEIIKKYDQVFIMQSSTNIDRTVSLLKATLRNNKKFVSDLFSYQLNKNIHHFFDYDNERVFVWIPLKYKYKSDEFKEKYINNIKTCSNIMPYYVMEVKESMLPDIKLLYRKGMIKNSCLIYSMWDGYIKKEEKLQKFIDELNSMNIYFTELHTSGHADIEAMEKLNTIVNPNNTIIIHTENKDEGKKIFNNVIDLNDNEFYNL